MLNIFIDPATAARGIPRKLSWLWPLLIVVIGTMTISYLTIPITLRIMQTNPPGNLTPEQVQRSLGAIEMTQKIGVFASPFIVVAILALLAGVLLAACSVLDIRASFRDLFSLLAHGSLIGFLAQVAGFIVVRAKGDEIQSMEQLRPAFGLDLVFHEGLSKPLLAVLNYFSIFTLWYIVVVGIALAALAGCARSKAFLASIPVWVIPMLFTVVFSLFGT